MNKSYKKNVSAIFHVFNFLRLSSVIHSKFCLFNGLISILQKCANLMDTKMSNAHKAVQQKLIIKCSVLKVIDMLFCFQLAFVG